MTVKIGTMNRDNFIKRYISGETLSKLSKEAHVDFRTAKRILNESGIKTRNMSESQIANLPIEQIIERYKSGESTVEIASDFNVWHTTIGDALKRNGIPIRPITERAKIGASKIDVKTRKRMMKIAQNSRRGNIDTIKTKIARAKTIERTGGKTSELESRFCQWLTESNISFKRQTAVGIYNIDITIGKIAVEIFGGNWHASPSRYRRSMKRAKYIFDRGWSIVYIWHNSTRYPISENAADYVISLADSFSSNPSSFGQYWVIRGDGQVCSIGCYDGNGIPNIPTSKNVKQAWRKNKGIT